jgi:hypothetical protein
MSAAEDREAERQAMQAEAERYAQQHNMIGEDGPPRVEPTPAELVKLYGGAEAASRVLGNLPATGGVRVTSLADMDAQRATMDAFWARGGGRFPDEFQPRKPDPKPPEHAPYPESWRDGRTWTVTGELVE